MIYLMASSTTCGCSSARQFLVLLLTQARFRLTLQSKKDAKTSFVICWDFAHVGSEYRLGVFQHVPFFQDASESIADFVDFVLRCFAGRQSHCHFRSTTAAWCTAMQTYTHLEDEARLMS